MTKPPTADPALDARIGRWPLDFTPGTAGAHGEYGYARMPDEVPGTPGADALALLTG